MVTGIESFKEWFEGNESQYAIIGGTACDILMTEEGLDFRATKDIDLVLIIEAVDAAFGRKFWDYVEQAGYEHCNKSSGMPQFYRFSHPTSNRYPAMIELFTRKLDAIQLSDDAVSRCTAVLFRSPGGREADSGSIGRRLRRGRSGKRGRWLKPSAFHCNSEILLSA